MTISSKLRVLTSILLVQESYECDRQRGKQILQLCMKRWKDDEFIPFEAEYALKQLKAQQSAIKQLSQNALKQAIKVQSLKQIHHARLEFEEQKRRVTLYCGYFENCGQQRYETQELRQREDWLRLLVNT